MVATAELKKEVTPHLVEDTRFWVVRPRISGGTVTGLGTLMGGSFIEIEVGKSTQPQRTFIGLEEPPVVTLDVPGSRFQLHSADLGSLDVGSPLYFRRIQVGQILSYELDQDGKGVTFKIFIKAPYDKYVKTTTRFWNASGIDLTMDANGLKLDTQSLVSILVGGIAFQTLDEEGSALPPGPNNVFTLFINREEAMKHRDTFSQSYVLTFKESIRGLTVGAPVDFRGLIVGEVAAINLEYDRSSKEINMLVDIRVYPARLRSKAGGSLPSQKDSRVTMDGMVNSGLRAQLKSGSLLTGQLFVSLDFFPGVSESEDRLGHKPAPVPHHPRQPGGTAGNPCNSWPNWRRCRWMRLSRDVRQALQSSMPP